MSNQVIVEVRHTPGDVLVLAEDNYGRTYRSYGPDVFTQAFPTVLDLLAEVSAFEELAGAFIVNEETHEMILEACNSVEVHGFDQNDPVTVNIFTNEEEE